MVGVYLSGTGNTEHCVVEVTPSTKESCVCEEKDGVYTGDYIYTKTENGKTSSKKISKDVRCVRRVFSTGTYRYYSNIEKTRHDNFRLSDAVFKRSVYGA